MTIETFRGEYFPFSNMYPLARWILADCGVEVPTAEHAYMSNRFKDPYLQMLVATEMGDPDDTHVSKDGVAAKKLAHALVKEGAEQTFRDDDERIALMRRVVTQKVLSNPDVSRLLIATGDQEIQEGNTWGDLFWGISLPGSGVGENHLGRIYMDIRAQLQAE